MIHAWMKGRGMTFAMLVGLTGALLTWSTENLIFQNQSDFARTVGFMLLDAFSATQARWNFVPGGFEHVEGINVASYCFGAFGWLQWIFSDHYELAVSSVAGKAIVIALLAVAAHQLAGRGRPLVRALLFITLSLAAFQAHNIGLMKSFYAEYVFFLALPLLLVGLLARDKLVFVVVLGLGSLIVGLAKIQFFYVPALVGVCLVLTGRAGELKSGRTIFVILLAAQLVCLVPLRQNNVSQLNYYQSTYFGSYMVLDEQQLRSVGLSDRELRCVGVDAWGHRASGAGGVKVESGSVTCHGLKRLTLKDVLEPYVRYPSIMFKLPLYALPAHFTVKYFHVYPDIGYLTRLDGPPRGIESLLMGLSDWRERLITPMAPVLLFWAVVACMLGLRAGQRRLASAILFLALFLASQVAVGLLGEGIRDLSKHLWAAQLALDILLCLLLYQTALGASRAARSWWRRSEATA